MLPERTVADDAERECRSFRAIHERPDGEHKGITDCKRGRGFASGPGEEGGLRRSARGRARTQNNATRRGPREGDDP